MPEKLDACVSSLLAKWKKDPKSRPAPKEDQKPEAQAHAICTASLKKTGKMDDLTAFSLEDNIGPVMVGAAATNRPHLKGLPAITELEDGILRVPLIVLGRWKHISGVLNFTRGYVSRLRDNFESNVLGMDTSLDARHLPQLGALAWFKRLAFEDQDDKHLLVGYADPTPSGKQVVVEKRYKYASIEFHPNYSHPLLEALSEEGIDSTWDGVDDIELEHVHVKEADMPETIGLEQRILALETSLEEAGKSKTDLEKLLQAERDRNLALEQQSAKRFVETVVLKAVNYRDSDGRAHPKLLLDWAKQILLGEAIGEGDETISLSDDADAQGAKVYFRRAVNWLLTNLPGVVPMTTSGERETGRTIANSDDVEFDEEDTAEIKSAWGY